MAATKVLLNIRKGIKIQPHQLSPTQLRPNLAFSDLYKKHLPCHPRAWGHTIAYKATRNSSMQIKRVRTNGKKTFGDFRDPFLPLLQPIRQAQIMTGTHLGIGVKQLLVRLLEQQRPWSWLHQDASLAGKKGRQETCCAGYATATSSRSIFFSSVCGYINC